jgi:hypothetical protein
VRRRCDGCRRGLRGKRGHGWLSTNGKGIRCNECDNPKAAARLKKKWRKRSIRIG